MENKKELVNKTDREIAMIRLLRGGATLEQTIDIINKLYIADGEKPDLEYVQKTVYEYHEMQLLDGKGVKKSVQNEVEDWIHSNTSNKACYYDVTCSLLTCYLDLGYTSTEQKAACRMAFRRLVERGKLIPLRNRSGLYKYMNGKSEDIDFMNADTQPFLFTCPFATHTLVNIYPKSIAIIAGEPNSGKTAYLLNLARKNMDYFPVQYFSSEMEATELKIRLKNFNMPLTNWQKVKFKFRTENFEEVVDPDGFNIIDYLQVHKDFYEISGLIHKIHEKLNKGVAFIALQKPKGRDEALGGQRTLDLARLYLAISPGIFKIVKAKVWHTADINPNGIQKRFKLGGGATFKMVNDNGEKSEWFKD